MLRSLRIISAAALLFLFASLSQGDAQTGARDRISGSISNGPLFTVAGNVNARAQTRYDQGPAPVSLPMPNITLMLAPTAQQHAALLELLAQQQEKTSPNFHKWLTPEQFADRFGLTQSDIGKITAWLAAQGFTLEKPARARNWITFDGTAGQVQAAFHTQIHYYLVNGKMHYANATAPAIPLSLAGIVSDIRGLHDFHPEPPRRSEDLPSKLHSIADFTNGPVGPGNEFLAPGDLANIYDIMPLYNAGTDGTGQSIAIVGQTDIVASDITDYQTLFGLPVVAPSVMLYGPDPCGGNINNCNPNDQIESDLDLEISNAVARNATIYYATSTDVSISAMEIIDNNLAPVMTMSYGGCELDDQSSLGSLQAEAQQANAEGITWMASSGDSGAAACDVGANIAQNGLQVNVPASIPEVTGVGGTEFDEGGNYSKYWIGVNGNNGGSALSYIPEIAWNDTAQAGVLDATGGGVSTFYALPYYQSRVSGIQGSMRNVPDVSLSASNGNDPYFICVQGSCEMSMFLAVGGTSASAPQFAGMVVLLNQYLTTQGTQPTPLGNINASLYSLAKTTPLAFHDITTGNNIVPCLAGTPDCPSNGMYGYSAATGYDPVTGLGSVDANVMVTNWVEAAIPATTTTLTASPTTIMQGASVTLTATVAPASGGGTPTGTVAFINSGVSLGTETLSGGVATLVTTALPVGTDSVTASYSGDSTFAGSVSLPVVVTVNPPPGFSVTSTPAGLVVSVGGTATSTLTVTSAGGFTGTVNLTCAGAPSEANCGISPGSVTLSANGTATATLTVATTAPSAIFGLRRVGPGPQAPLLLFTISLMGLMGLALAHKLLAAAGASLRWPALAGVIVLAAVGMASCGGGGGSSGNPGTPPGSYTITVTGASGTTTHTLSIPLSVNAAP
jgi:subtilase family serine protease